ncbi:hypothetical protein IGI04_011969 [Brassica rapa subsp. trilocularis]|uniref:Secreted protein n=1 Tax=Brassica rapa subsp. trilocularis TaxID=1813537 RepID=A0ABQ7N710_BRACM|nr:hypothetical protein IGI04_011969 [Brassica rapa subsp. trilocularis]
MYTFCLSLALVLCTKDYGVDPGEDATPKMSELMYCRVQTVGDSSFSCHARVCGILNG